MREYVNYEKLGKLLDRVSLNEPRYNFSAAPYRGGTTFGMFHSLAVVVTLELQRVVYQRVQLLLQSEMLADYASVFEADPNM